MKSILFRPFSTASSLFIPFDFTKLSSECHALVGLWDYKLGWDGVRVHHRAGLQRDAPRESLAGAAVGPRMDDLRVPRGRWVAVVLHGTRHPVVWGPVTFRGPRSIGPGGGCGSRNLSVPEKTH